MEGVLIGGKVKCLKFKKTLEFEYMSMEGVLVGRR